MNIANSLPLPPKQAPGQIRVRHVQRGTRAPNLLMAKQEVGTKQTNTGINLNMINMNAIKHNKKVDNKKPEFVRQKILKPVAQAYRSQMCMFSVDVPQENMSPPVTPSSGSPIAPGSRMNTIFSSHNWGSRK